MVYLITGGSGFIGSALIRYLIKNTSHTIVNIDKLTYSSSNNKSLSEISSNTRYHFEKTDIINFERVNEILINYRPNIIINLAAETHVDRSISDPDIFIQSNILGTYNLLKCSKKYYDNISKKEKKLFKFHQVSTDEVFGDLTLKSSAFTEESSYKPNSPYSSSKAACDHLVNAWNRTYYLPTLITNCSNNYGPYQFPEKLIPLTIKNALNLEPIPVYGKGNQIRDWLFVEDHAEALYLVASKGRISQKYNIGGRQEKTNLEVVMAICKILKELKPINSAKMESYEDLIKFVEDRPGHDFRYALNINKIEDELGWKPRETFDSGLRKTVEWYLEVYGT